MNIPTTKTVKAFKDYDFENCDVPKEYWGDYTHLNFFKRYFIPIVRKEYKALAKKIGAELISFSANNFEWTAFFKKDDKFVYVSTSDVRYWKWYDSVLFRTAVDEHDYTGGANNYCSYDRLAENLEDMFGLLGAV